MNSNKIFDKYSIVVKLYTDSESFKNGFYFYSNFDIKKLGIEKRLLLSTQVTADIKGI